MAAVSKRSLGFLILKFGLKVDNIGIIPKVKLVPEAQPRDTKYTEVIIAINYFNNKPILMARSFAEGPNF